MQSLFFKFLSISIVVFVVFSCKQDVPQAAEMPLEIPNHGKAEKTVFGETPDGIAHLYTLENSNGLSVKITNYGAIITSLFVPDRDGKFDDVVLGYDSLAHYLKGHPYFGAVVGRYGNRIAKGKFSIDGEEYRLAVNNGENHLHGGIKGFDKVLWEEVELKAEGGGKLKLRHISKDLEEGYPGNLTVDVTYHLTNDNLLLVYYDIETDKKTICNPTQHTYFNLGGEGNGTILDHVLMLKAGHYTPVDETLIPTGEIATVEGTPFDFRTAKRVGEEIDATHEQITFGKGYDHNWVFDRAKGGLQFVGSLYEPNSGRYMEIFTEEPGIQFYTGNFLDGSLTGKSGQQYEHRTGLCLETQHYPDSPNQPNFPSVVKDTGKIYKTSTFYKFGIKEEM